MTLSKEQALERITGMYKSHVEVMDFAQKHNDLSLYKAAEIDCAALYEAVQALKASLSGAQGQ